MDILDQSRSETGYAFTPGAANASIEDSVGPVLQESCRQPLGLFVAIGVVVWNKPASTRPKIVELGPEPANIFAVLDPGFEDANLG